MNKKLLLAEDEPLAQARITSILKKHRPEWEVLDAVQSVSELRDALQSPQNYHLILCDIHLADGLSFSAFRGMKIDVPVVFITAYDQYALESFEHNCVDYVLKPIEEDRLVRAFDKIAKMENGPQTSFLPTHILDQISQFYVPKNYKKRFLTKMGNRLVFVPVEQIACFYAEEGVTFLLEAGTSQKYVVEFSLNELQSEYLDPSKFFRVNRSSIIGLESLVEMKPFTNGRLALVLKAKTEQTIIVAREKVNEFKSWINQ